MLHNDKNIQRRRLDELQPHPKQARYFSDVPEEQLAALAEDMEKNGLLQPVETTSDGTIIAGHQRVRAAGQLGWEMIEVWVRDDLEQEGELAIEERLLEDNLHRRQLSKLGQARIYKGLRQVKAKRGGALGGGDQRDALGIYFGVKGRTLDRWARILTTPATIQHAVEAETLSMQAALRIADLPLETQREIGKLLKCGEDPKALLKKYVQPKKPQVDVRRWARTLVGELRQFDEGFQVARQEIRRRQSRKRLEQHFNTDDLPTLKAVAKQLQRLIKYVEQHPDECSPHHPFAELLDSLQTPDAAA